MPALHNKKWETACQAFVLEGVSRTEAYRRAFPKARHSTLASLWNKASELFRNPKVAARVVELEAEKTEAVKKEFAVDALYVLRRLVEIDRMDIADILDEEDGYLRPVKEWPQIWRQFINQFEVEELFAGRGDERLKVGLLKKIKWPDKIRALETLGKHVNVMAFKEVQEISGPGGGPLQLINTEMTPQEAAEAYASTLHN